MEEILNNIIGKTITNIEEVYDYKLILTFSDESTLEISAEGNINEVWIDIKYLDKELP